MARGKLCGSRCAGWLESTIRDSARNTLPRPRTSRRFVIRFNGRIVRTNEYCMEEFTSLLSFRFLVPIVAKIWRRRVFGKIFVSSISIDDSLILIFRSFVNNFTNLEWDENICFVKILLRWIDCRIDIWQWM